MINKETSNFFAMTSGAFFYSKLAIPGVFTSSTAASLPLFLGMFVGVTLLLKPCKIIYININKTYVEQSQQNYYHHFLLNAAFGVLSLAIGIMTISLFITTVANPFTLPALITAGISAALMLALYVKTKPREECHSLDLETHNQYPSMN